MAKAKRKTQPTGPGYDGHVIVKAHVQLSAVRSENRDIRCLPGSFEWSYGSRKNVGTLYHAGVHFSGLWERANITVQSPNLVPTPPAQYRGITDSRAEALSEIQALSRSVGTYAMSRLIDYCILGNTTAEIGAKYGMDSKKMHGVLQADLTDVASHFRFV